MIMSLYNTMQEKKVDVVRGNYYIESKNGHRIKGNTYGFSSRVLDKGDIEDKLLPNLLESKLQCYVWLLLIPSEKVKQVGEFDKELYLLEDTLFYINLLLKVKSIYILEEPLYNYNVTNISSATKSDKYYIRNMNNMLKVNTKIKKALKNLKQINDRCIQIIDTRHLTCIINYIYLIYKSERNFKKAIQQFNKISESTEIQEMLKNYNPKIISTKQQIENKLVLKKYYKILKIFYLIKILLSKIK